MSEVEARWNFQKLPEHVSVTCLLNAFIENGHAQQQRFEVTCIAVAVANTLTHRNTDLVASGTSLHAKAWGGVAPSKGLQAAKAAMASAAMAHLEKRTCDLS